MDSQGSDPNLLTYPLLQSLLRVEFARSRRYDYPLSCLIMQVDRLDHLRDLYGTSARQEILQAVVKLAQSQTRLSDAIAAYGDRVTVVLPHTESEGAMTIAQRICEKVSELSFRVQGREIGVTASIGLASCSDRQTIFYDALLRNAEEALTAAAAGGGNRVEVARPSSPSV